MKDDKHLIQDYKRQHKTVMMSQRSKPVKMCFGRSGFKEVSDFSSLISAVISVDLSLGFETARRPHLKI